MSAWRLDQSNRAREDLLAIWAYVGAENPEAADRLLHALVDLFRKTLDFPSMGRPVDELKPGYRQLSRGPYLLFYRLEEETHTVRLMRVIHGARNLPTVLDEE